MSLTLSSMLALGTKAPNFNLPDTVSGETKSLSELKGEVATVIAFISNHCPYVHHVNKKLVEVAKTYQNKGVQFVAISSNNVKTHPQDAPELMTKVANDLGYPFPYLFDESQDIAKAYKAECTPDFFVFDTEMKCVYRGRFDETRPGNGEATGEDLTNALDELLAGEAITAIQHPSMGCNIKWK